MDIFCIAAPALESTVRRIAGRPPVRGRVYDNGIRMHTHQEGPSMTLVDCRCGAQLAAQLIVRDDVGDQNRCPECHRYHEACPGCGAWLQPFHHSNDTGPCPSCGLARDAKTALRLDNDHPRGLTGPEVRGEFDRADLGEFVDDGTTIDYPEEGDPVATGGAD